MNSEIFFNVFFAFFDALFLSSILLCAFFTRSFCNRSFLWFYLLTHERRRRIDALFLSLIFFARLRLPSFSDSFTPKNPSTTYYNLCRYKFLNLKNYPKSEVKNGSRDADHFSDLQLLQKFTYSRLRPSPWFSIGSIFNSFYLFANKRSMIWPFLTVKLGLSSAWEISHISLSGGRGIRACIYSQCLPPPPPSYAPSLKGAGTI